MANAWASRSICCFILMAVSAIASGRDNPWTIADIVDVTRIESVAVSASGKEAAYILRVPSVASDSVEYLLYQVALSGKGRPLELLRSGYMTEVRRAPHMRRWSVLADLGAGVQLYSVTETGAVAPLAVSVHTIPVGTFDGAIGPMGKPRRVGVYSYQWSPDGTELWYSTFRTRSASQIKEYIEKGVEYDDRALNAVFLRNSPGRLAGFELHVERANRSGDRVVAFVPTVQAMDATYLRRDLGTALWMSDSRHIEYSTDVIGKSGALVPRLWSVDVDSGVNQALPAGSPWWTMAVPTADGRGYYEVRSINGKNHLVKYDFDGGAHRDLGHVRFSMVGMSATYPGGTWTSAASNQQIMAVLYKHHTGLVIFPKSAAAARLAKRSDNLGPCDFFGRLSVGVCVRQAQTLPPELDIVDTDSGTVRPIARPDSRYDEVSRLHIQYERWTNRYGQKSDGYLVYPRNFVTGRRYPAILVTHADSAVNTFADEGLQAEIPVQALAEVGYLVVEANTPWVSLAQGRPGIVHHIRTSAAAVRQRDRELIQEPVASMEAAIGSLERAGLVNPEKVGIAGYSAGADLALFAMTQSKMFKVASIDDGAAAADADLYWRCGTRDCTALHRALYGGSPYSSNPEVMKAYRRFCPDFRVASFAGPLLEQPSGTVMDTFARLVLLRQASIPHDVIFYPHESHIFWDPRAEAASMRRTLIWFNYWLLGRRSRNPADAREYRRWDIMRRAYGKRCPACLSALGPWTHAAAHQIRGRAASPRN